MNTLDAYKDKLQAKYDQFTAQVREAGADARIESHGLYADFQSKKNEFETAWNEFTKASEEKAEALKARAEAKYKDMEAAWKELKSDL